MNVLPFRELATYPDSINGTGVIVRLLDGIGFRFYWATENLSEDDYCYRAVPAGMSIGEITAHIWGLINWIRLHVTGEGSIRPQQHDQIRHAILQNLLFLRNTFARMNDEQLREIQIEKKPFWHLINGPLADALTHIGQINILRRAAGNPPLSLNPFLGIPPEASIL